MELLECMKARHSVRQYSATPIEEEKRVLLQSKMDELNQESGLHMQIFFEEPKCFDSMLAHYGKFTGVNNYIAIVGKKGKDFEEKTGYYGEQLVLYAQSLGLNTCWVALTHGKCAAEIGAGEKLSIVIAIGHGQTQGSAHKNKSLSELTNVQEMPEWFKNGMEAVLLAPTAMNQQKFFFELKEDQVYAKAGRGFYTKMDLGIAKYHFEAISKHKVF